MLELLFAIVARIGTVELAAANVIGSIHTLAVMLAVELGIAASAPLGQNLGAAQAAERMTWEAVKLATFPMVAVLSRAILLIHTSDPDVIAVGRWPLVFLGRVQALPGTALVLSQALQRAGNTRFVMFTNLVVCLTLHLPVVYLLSLRTPLRLLEAWTGKLACWGARTLTMVGKFRRGT